MTSETATARYTSFAEFYPFYLGEHSNLVCRRLHFVVMSKDILSGRVPF